MQSTLTVPHTLEKGYIISCFYRDTGYYRKAGQKGASRFLYHLNRPALSGYPRYSMEMPAINRWRISVMVQAVAQKISFDKVRFDKVSFDEFTALYERLHLGFPKPFLNNLPSPFTPWLMVSMKCSSFRWRGRVSPAFP
jgi:hypothetical protein